MKRILGAGLFVGVLVLGAAALPGESRLVVHEWGTFTSVSGADGLPMVWRPLSGPLDVPTFVYTNQPKASGPEAVLDKLSAQTTVRMETPVLYFYSDRPTDVDVQVRFPQGQVTEWYPKARAVTRGIDWGRIQVRPGAGGAFPREKGESHYYPARETDASPVRTPTAEEEKFLFYRGVAWFDPILKITLDGDQGVVKNLGKEVVPQAILFENREGSVGFRILGAIRDEVRFTRPEASPGGVAAVLAELERTLIRLGLYEKEARAMVTTWRDSWFEEGLRLFYFLPRPAVDALLPLSLDPHPGELARVFVGRAELITPEMERRALAIVKKARGDLANARRDLQGFGRFLGPVLSRVLPLAAEPELQERIQKLLR